MLFRILLGLWISLFGINFANAKSNYCHIAGDSIAYGLSQKMKECTSNAKVGIPSKSVISRAHDSENLIISAGSNDPYNSKLKKNLIDIRSKASHNVIWILPINSTAAKTVNEIANKYGDKTVKFKASKDNVHPKSYGALARDVRKLLNKEQTT